VIAFTRHQDERIVIVAPGLPPLTIRVDNLTPRLVRLGVDGPTAYAVHRGEIYDAALRANVRTDVPLVALSAEDIDRVRAAAAELQQARTA